MNNGKKLNYNSTEYKKKCAALRQQLHDKGIKYCLYENPTKDPNQRITICMAKLPSGKYVRGVAICSPEDNFCRAVGYFYAMVRVLKGAKHKSYGQITTRRELECRKFNDGTLFHFPKINWNCRPTSLERTMLGEEVSHENTQH